MSSSAREPVCCLGDRPARNSELLCRPDNLPVGQGVREALEGGRLRWSEKVASFPPLGITQLALHLAHAGFLDGLEVHPDGLSVRRLAQSLRKVDGASDIIGCALRGLKSVDRPGRNADGAPAG